MDTHEHIHFKRFAALVGLIVLVIVIVYVLSAIRDDVTPNGEGFSIPTSLNTAIAAGDFVLAGQEARQLLAREGTLSPTDASFARLAIADATGVVATSSSDRSSAIADDLENYHAVSDAFTRAWLLDRLAALVMNTDINVVAASLSNDQEFSHLIASTQGDTATNIASYSYAIYPTSVAAYCIAGNNAQHIVDVYMKAGHGTASASSTIAAKSVVLSWIAKGDTMRTIEMQYASSSPYGVSVQIAMTDLYRYFPISAVALVDASYQADANATFQDIYDAYASSQEGNGNPPPQLIQAAVAAHFSQASFLFLEDPVANKALVAANLKQALLIVNQYPDVTQRFADSFNQNQVSTDSFSQEEDFSKKMAAISPEFKAFLTSQGWNFGK